MNICSRLTAICEALYENANIRRDEIEKITIDERTGRVILEIKGGDASKDIVLGIMQEVSLLDGIKSVSISRNATNMLVEAHIQSKWEKYTFYFHKGLTPQRVEEVLVQNGIDNTQYMVELDPALNPSYAILYFKDKEVQTKVESLDF